MEEQTFCKVCLKPLKQPKTGRRRETCSDACRQKLYRNLKRARGPYVSRTLLREDREGELRVRAYERKHGQLPWRVQYRIKRGLPVLECAVCGRPFILDQLNPPHQSRYCSTTCCKRARWQRKKVRRAVERAEGLIDDFDLWRVEYRIRHEAWYSIRICVECELPFVIDTNYGPPPKYCSARCRMQAYERRYRRRYRRKRLHRYKDCPVCGGRFDTHDSAGRRNRLYCSERCKHVAYVRRKAG